MKLYLFIFNSFVKYDSKNDTHNLCFEQAKTLKTICTPDQMKKFESLVIDIRDYFKPRKK